MSVTLSAHAKINLTLYVTGRRTDGYHALYTVMQSLALADTVRVSVGGAGGIRVTCSDASLSGRRNLAYTAAQVFLRRVGYESDGVAINVDKRIPTAAGLGGGSADAAAVLMGLNEQYGRPLSRDDLAQLAVALGADVPFCLTGGTALAQGIGERLQALPPPPACTVVLAKPCAKVSTGVMFQKFDERKGLSCPPDRAIINELSKGDLDGVASRLHNDFLPLWEGQAVHDALSVLTAFGAAGVSLTGSGPTVFGLFAHKKSAADAVTELATRGISGLVTRFSPAGCTVVSRKEEPVV